MRHVAVLAVALALAGCAIPQRQTPVYSLNVSFDPGHAARLLQSGTNSISGNAFMRQRGGGVVTCAGANVYLIPATDYARARFVALYGPVESGTSRRAYDFRPDSQEYFSMVKTTRCDGHGNFRFENVADGEFFVQTIVAWEVARSIQGGSLMHRVRVSNGQSVSVVLSS